MSKYDQSQVGETLHLTSNIVAAYVSNNKVNAADLPALMADIHESLQDIAAGDASLRTTKEPAVPISKSVTPEFIICLEDGKKLKMLKRYLRTHFQLTPEEYIRKWNLPSDYPMVAPNYAKKRSSLAKQIGLGTQRGAVSTPKPKRKAGGKRGRPKKR